jgi:hypothetical protein
MHTFGMILVLVGGILVVLDWLFGPPAPAGRRQIARAGLLHLAILLVAVGVLCLFAWDFSHVKLAGTPQ